MENNRTIIQLHCRGLPKSRILGTTAKVCDPLYDFNQVCVSPSLNYKIILTGTVNGCQLHRDKLSWCYQELTGYHLSWFTV